MATYYNYQPEDFAQDSSFQKWVRGDSPEDTVFWERFRSEYPEKTEALNMARMLVQGIVFDKKPVDPQITRQDWEMLQARLQTAPPQWTRRNVLLMYRGGMAAALVILLIATFVFWWFTRVPQQLYTTRFGETKHLTLPDGSRVTLNAHSTLRVPDRWKDADEREVWLEGEAFFEVTQQRQSGNPVKFVVHTADVNVEVLGTVFNVKRRRERTQVTLESGKVKLTLNQSNASPLVMQPGEQVEYSRQQLTKRLVSPRQYSAWRQDQLILDGKTLADVARVLEETYGRKPVFEQSAMARMELSGTYPLGDMDRLLKALAVTTQLTITYTDTHIFFQSPVPGSSTP